MTVDSDLVKLREFIDSSSEVLNSGHDLLQKSRSLMQGTSGDVKLVNEVKKIQREFLLNSLRINKFHRDYKDWENEDTSEFVNGEVRKYNRVYGESYRVNAEIEKLEEVYHKLKHSVRIPSFEFSIQAIEKSGDQRLLEHLPRDEAGNYPSIVNMSDIFSFDADSQLSMPDLDIFKRLLNLEYRLRIERRVCYEILQVVKNQQTSGNKKWTVRDVALNDFVTKQLGDVLHEIGEIKKNEFEDLKGFNYYSGEEEEDDADQDELEQEIEEEEDEEEEEIPDLDEDKVKSSEDNNEPQFSKDDDVKEQSDQESGRNSPHDPQHQDNTEFHSERPLSPNNAEHSDDEMLVDI